MDDYKRGLYMQVLRKLKALQAAGGPAPYICSELKEVACNELPADFDAAFGYTPQIIREFFPEFMALFDGTYWRPDELFGKTDLGDPWWKSDWIEPRIRALECILRD